MRARHRRASRFGSLTRWRRRLARFATRTIGAARTDVLLAGGTFRPFTAWGRAWLATHPEVLTAAKPRELAAIVERMRADGLTVGTGKGQSKRAAFRRSKAKYGKTRGAGLRAKKGSRRRHKRRHPSAHVLTDAPLAVEYRAARTQYRKAGRALKKSCSGKRRACGYPRAPAGARRRVGAIKNVAAMRREFLNASAGSGTNENVIEQAIGSLRVRDATTWEPLAERFASGKVETFAQAFAIAARESRRNGRLTWDKFPIDAFRECANGALAGLQLPEYVAEAQELNEQAARYYGEAPPF